MGWGDFFDVAGTLLGAYDSYSSNKQKSDDAKKQAKLAEAKRVDALQRGALEADRLAQKKRALMGKQRAAMGASGIVAGSGTFSDVLSDTEKAGREDEDTTFQNAVREAWGYQQEAKMARDASNAYESSAWIGGLGTLAAGTYKYGTKKGWWE